MSIGALSLLMCSTTSPTPSPVTLLCLGFLHMNIHYGHRVLNLLPFIPTTNRLRIDAYMPWDATCNYCYGLTREYNNCTLRSVMGSGWYYFNVNSLAERFLRITTRHPVGMCKGLCPCLCGALATVVIMARYMTLNV